MVHYKIKQYTIDQSKKYGYEVKVSTDKRKKIDVYKDNVKIASLGDILYKDYPTYILEKGIAYANIRRALYYKRHKKDIERTGSNGWLSSILLW